MQTVKMWGTKNIYNKKMYGQKVEIHIKIGTKNIFIPFFITFTLTW
jgi:hypothetical protein